MMEQKTAKAQKRQGIPREKTALPRGMAMSA
jgi:hypothetical protein